MSDFDWTTMHETCRYRGKEPVFRCGNANGELGPCAAEGCPRPGPATVPDPERAELMPEMAELTPEMADLLDKTYNFLTDFSSHCQPVPGGRSMKIGGFTFVSWRLKEITTGLADVLGMKGDD